MTKQLTLSFLLALPIMGSAQGQRIVLQGAGQPQLFTDLGPALVAAQANDVLYLSGGSFSIPGGTIINTRVHVVGAGLHPDSTNVTGTTTITVTGSGGPLMIGTSAGGSSFTGIRFNHNGGLNAVIKYGTSIANDDPLDMLFQRCQFQQDLELGTGPLNTTTPSSSTSAFDECIFHRSLHGYGGSAVISRCIFDFDPGSGAPINFFQPDGLVLEHSVVLGGYVANSPNGLVRNCILTQTTSGPVWQSNNATVQNCLITANETNSNSIGVSSSGNILNQAPSAIFVSDPANAYVFTADLHLLPGSPGIGAATDGIDIGLYGSPSPYKPGAVPYNPHFRLASIAPATNLNGELPVNIRVAAQPN